MKCSIVVFNCPLPTAYCLLLIAHCFSGGVCATLLYSNAEAFEKMQPLLVSHRTMESAKRLTAGRVFEVIQEFAQHAGLEV
jgi:hypothetical protein